MIIFYLIALLPNRWAAFKLGGFHGNVTSGQSQIMRTRFNCNWNSVLLGLFDERNGVSTRKMNDVTRNSLFPNTNLAKSCTAWN